MSKASSFGALSWTIVFVEGDVVNLCADRIEVTPSGAIVAWGGYRKDNLRAPDGMEIVVYAVAAGQWANFFSASTLDGHPVACWRP